MLAYMVTVNPMTDTVNNAIQVANEAIVLICIWTMLWFTEYVGSPETRYDLGTVFLVFLAIAIGLNVLILFYTILKGVYKAVKQCVVKRRAKK